MEIMHDTMTQEEESTVSDRMKLGSMKYWVTSRQRSGVGVKAFAGPFPASESFRADRISDAINQAAGDSLTQVSMGGREKDLGSIVGFGGRHAGRDYPAGS